MQLALARFACRTVLGVMIASTSSIPLLAESDLTADVPATETGQSTAQVKPKNPPPLRQTKSDLLGTPGFPPQQIKCDLLGTPGFWRKPALAFVVSFYTFAGNAIAAPICNVNCEYTPSISTATLLDSSCLMHT
jgi:hypothetical protein